MEKKLEQVQKVGQLEGTAQLIVATEETKKSILRKPIFGDASKTIVCCVCGKAKPMTSEYFWIYRDFRKGKTIEENVYWQGPKASKDSIGCKECYKAYRRELLAKQKPKETKKPKEASKELRENKPKEKVAKIPKKTKDKKIAKVELGTADRQIAKANKIHKDIQAELEGEESKKDKVKSKSLDTNRARKGLGFTNLPFLVTNNKDETKQVIKVQSHYIIKKV
jgi:hypothetical protein